MSAIASLATRLGMKVRPPDPPALALVPDVPEVTGPRTLKEIIGQDDFRVQAEMFLIDAVMGDRLYPHSLLQGPPGVGKSRTARVIATELGKPFRATTGEACKGRGLAMLLAGLEPGTVVFIDEIHALRQVEQEALGLAMVDWKLYLPARGTQAPVEIDVECFTLIGATTEPGKLTKPLLDRFVFCGDFILYTTEELAEIVTADAERLGVRIDPDAALVLASRSRGTPRAAGNLLAFVRAYINVMGHDSASVTDVEAALTAAGVDSLGCNRADQQYLEALVELTVDRAGTPVGLAPLLSCSGLDRKTVEIKVEPFLRHAGLLRFTDRGRTATEAAFSHCRPGQPVPIFLRRK